jgi:translocation and assembly module TamB
MAEDAVIDEAPPEAVPVRRRHWAVRVTRWITGALVALIALFGIALVVLNSPIGHRYVAERLAEVAPASGLRFKVGRIEGSLYGQAVMRDVVFSDPKGAFLTVPVVELDWRPIHWFTTGLDVRKLVLRRGTMLRTPALLPGDPDAPILPDFDIRIDRFELDDLTLAEGIVGKRRTIDFVARTRIEDGRAYLKADGDLGGGDRLHALVDAEPDGNRFDLDFDYRAPTGGLLAGLVGADKDIRIRLLGDGTWTKWNGSFVTWRGAEPLAAFKLRKTSEFYRITGQGYPQDFLSGTPRGVLGSAVSLAALGTFQERVLDGELAVRGAGLNAEAKGTIDLAKNLVDTLTLDARLTNPNALAGLTLRGARVTATVDGEFQDLTIAHDLRIGELVSGQTRVANLAQKGTATYDGTRWTLPLDLSVGRVRTGQAMLDARLVNGRGRGTLVLAGNRVLSNNLAVDFPTLAARLALQGDLDRGVYALTGPVRARGLALENLGTVDANADIRFTLGGRAAWTLRADLTGSMPRVTNATLANIAGTNIRFGGGLAMGANQPILLNGAYVRASKLQLFADASLRADGRATLMGSGTHTEYGPFTVEGVLTNDGPRATLVFANPLPAAGLRDVRVALAPIADGFAIDTEGQSALGPFDGRVNLFMPSGGPTRIAIERMDVWKTSVTGELTLGDGGVAGALALTGGGVNGTVGLAPREGGQGFDVALTARDASFAGATPLVIRQADVKVAGLIGSGRTEVNGTVQAQGISYGTLFIGRLAANATMNDGRGTFAASVAGRRQDRFVLQLLGDIAPERISLAAKGEYGGRPVTMPRRAVLLKQADGAWQLQPTQLSFGGGAAIAEGTFGGTAPAQGKFQFAKMPLSLIDVAGGDLGLGGTISGVVELGSTNGVPTGNARVMIDDLTRSGLVLSSSPIDLALVADLSPTVLQARAVVSEGGQQRGRLQGRIAGLPAAGGLMDRLWAGDLFAQLRYNGPAEGLWRLAAIETFDVTGSVAVAADARGTLANPQVRGSLAGDALRVQSALTGTDVRNVRMRGNFSGSLLRLTSFAGTTGEEGRVTGSGTVDIGNLATRGPAIDLRLAASNARILNRADMAATVTGPIRIVSDGNGGTIAGRLKIDRARWALGGAEAVRRLPNITTREINLPPDRAAGRAASAPWRYLIDARAPSRVDVRGLGLDSEWGADIKLRGTTDDPRIGGEANLVRGSYSFAGTRFELSRGKIDFDATTAINPRLDIAAETSVQGLSVTVTVRGDAMQPEIAFNSVPALPEEELLARLLFGGSVTELSATDALQLGAALASLRGGGGMDPINRLRTSIGLDRLRIVPADPALDRETAIALGKNIGSKFYAEIITDGRGYSATEVEFRVTSWLSLLATVSTVGRHGVSAEISKDY